MGSQRTDKKIIIDFDFNELPRLMDILKLAREHAPGSGDVEALKSYAKHYSQVVKRTFSPELQYRVKLAIQLASVLQIKNLEFNNSLFQKN